MGKENLDLIDKKILHELDKNARMSYSLLGKKTRIAKETVKYRIIQLQKRGIVSGFYTIINFSKLDFIVYRLYLRLQNVNPQTEKQIIEYLKNSKVVSFLYHINGPYDIATGVWTKAPWDFEDFWTTFKIKFGMYLSSYHISIMSEYVEFTRNYLINPKLEKAAFVGLCKSTKQTIDRLDYALLTELSANARASLVELSKKTNSSIITVRNRIRNLIKNKVIVGFRPIINLEQLGYRYYKVDVWLTTYEHLNQIQGHIRGHPNVIYAEKSLTTSDLEFDIEARNFDEFQEIMNHFRSKFADIKQYQYYERTKNYKTNYIPSF